MSARQRMEHLVDRWAVWAFAIATCARVIAIILWPHVELFTHIAMWVVLALFLLSTFMLGRKHEPITCAICWDKFPVNPAEHAARRARPSLAYTHVTLWLADRLRRLRLDARNAAIIASLGLTVALLSVFRLFIDPPWISIVLGVYLGFYVESVRRHAQLSPWCPWCRHGGEGEEEPEVPDPQPSTGRDLTPVGAS